MGARRFQHAIDLRESGRAEEALGELTDLAVSTTDPEERASLLLNQAKCLMKLGRLRDAREQLSSAKSIAPRTQLLLYLAFGEASLYSHEGDWRKALDILEDLHKEFGELLEATEHRDLYEQTQILRGVVLRAEGRVHEARAVLEECQSFALGEGDRNYVLYNLGAC